MPYLFSFSRRYYNSEWTGALWGQWRRWVRSGLRVRDRLVQFNIQPLTLLIATTGHRQYREQEQRRYIAFFGLPIGNIASGKSCNHASIENGWWQHFQQFRILTVNPPWNIDSCSSSDVVKWWGIFIHLVKTLKQDRLAEIKVLLNSELI